MTLLELRKLAENATHNHKDDFRGWIKESHVKEFNKTMNPSTALKMIGLLEEASSFIRALNIVPPTKECERMTAKWLKDLEEL